MSSSPNTDSRATTFGVLRTAGAARGAQYASRALQALELLAFQSLSAPQVAATLQIHPRTARRLLLTMAADGYIEQTFDSRRRYRSTLWLAALGSQVVAHAELPRAAAPVVADLHARTGAVAHLVVPSYRGAVCVVHCARLHAAEPPEPALRELLPAHATAPGKVLLAYRQTWRDSVLAEPPSRYTERTLTSAAEIEAAAIEIRTRGYAVDDREYQLDTLGIAAPVFADREVPAALAVTTEARPIEDPATRDLSEELLRSASALTSTLRPTHVTR
jgi:DNA-binding IclR family transcriptional regulator